MFSKSFLWDSTWTSEIYLRLLPCIRFRWKFLRLFKDFPSSLTFFKGSFSTFGVFKGLKGFLLGFHLNFRDLLQTFALFLVKIDLFEVIEGPSLAVEVFWWVTFWQIWTSESFLRIMPHFVFRSTCLRFSKGSKGFFWDSTWTSEIFLKLLTHFGFRSKPEFVQGLTFIFEVFWRFLLDSWGFPRAHTAYLGFHLNSQNLSYTFVLFWVQMNLLEVFQGPLFIFEIFWRFLLESWGFPRDQRASFGIPPELPRSFSKYLSHFGFKSTGLRLSKNLPSSLRFF